jgi:ribosomal protein L35AE/L33A
MKTLLLATVLMASANVMAQEWSETFKLPEGITFRARTAGYDCGTFTTNYVVAPGSFQALNIEFKQLAADKDLNKFLFEAVYPGSEGNTCTYGVYLDRSRDTKTLDFTHSLIKTEGSEESCLEAKSFLDSQLASVAYEGSKRGIRYVAVQIIKDEVNDVCENGNVRVVFDRRLVE